MTPLREPSRYSTFDRALHPLVGHRWRRLRLLIAVSAVFDEPRYTIFFLLDLGVHNLPQWPECQRANQAQAPHVP
jgi:hypothetical protein